MTDRKPGAPGQYKAVITASERTKMQNGQAFTILLERDDQPITEGTPYSKAVVLPDALAAILCPDMEDPTPADAFGSLLPRNGGVPMTGALAMGGNKITGLGTPTSDADAATKAYADSRYTGYHKQLTAADNLDNITADGVYFYATGNAPANAYWNAASIVVVFGAPASSKKKIQIEIRYGVSGCMAFRSLQSSGWQPWTQVAMQNDVDAKAQIDLLWQNASSGYSFPAQTITVDRTNYDYMLVIAFFKAGDSRRVPAWMSSSWTSTGGYLGGVLAKDSLQGASRTITSADNTTITFGPGYLNGSEDNKACVPYQVFGIRRVNDER